jgi:alginate O-acetyltransferase complex protein AlgI
MYFNSWKFIVFFLAVYTVYIILPRHRWQNLLLLASSYYFYSAWDWRFLSLILISTFVDYIAGIQIHNRTDEHSRRLFLALSVATNLGLLGFFKYFNFFAENLQAFLTSMGLDFASSRLDIILPVGISFYTFQTMSYTIDIYRRKLEPTHNFLDFALFVAFFPQLVAGPIERARRLLPQITNKRTIEPEQFRLGVWLIFWGLYKKVVIADNMAIIVEQVFLNSTSATFLSCYLSIVAFAVQIYCDFSGYSDIARGCAKVLGFELMLNFNLPYFAKNPSEFWRRWHISLSTWLRDYLYISLGGNRKGEIRTYLNLFLTMLLGGLWHGAAWNFIWWGIYHGALLMGHRLLTRSKELVDIRSSLWIQLSKTLVMFQFTLFGWLLFRANRRIVDGELTRDDSFIQIVEFITSYRNGLGFDVVSMDILWKIVMFTMPLAMIQLFQYKSDNLYFMLEWRSVSAKAVLFASLAFTWLIWGVQFGESFIYFQF